MASSDQVTPDRRYYGDHRPYPDPPAQLSDLTGPAEGLIELPITIDWGPKRIYDMGREAERRIAYERVLREAATSAEVARYVNGALLPAEWSQLFLPLRIRQLWEQRFPELARAT